MDTKPRAATKVQKISRKDAKAQRLRAAGLSVFDFDAMDPIGERSQSEGRATKKRLPYE
jgi:hypothetical protein